MDLCTACGLGLVEYVKNEIRRNPRRILKPNEKGWTPIMYACVYSRLKMVSLIARSFPSSVYATNDQGQTPLMLAVKTGDMDIVKILTKRDLLDRKDKQGRTALFYAAYFDQEDIAYYLIKCGADVNARDYESRTVLMTAIESGHESMIEILIIFGAKYDLKTDYIESNALHQKHFQLLLLLNITSVTDLNSFLHILGLDEYALFFEEKRIHLYEFLKLSESDLKTIGVRKLGPRRKMVLAAQKYNYLRELSKQLQNSTYY